MSIQRSLSETFRFGRFTVCTTRRELLVDGVVVELGSRNYDLLVALVAAGGDLVTKDELMSQVWPRRIVEENNLQACISRLRKVLGKDRGLIRTIAGRGYRFIGMVHECPAQAARADSRLPLPPTPMIDRSGLLLRLRELLLAERLVTLCGAGGIGKTRLAIEAAHGTRPQLADGAWLVDLSTLDDPALVPHKVCQVLGLKLEVADVPSIARALAPLQLLLILDNCEHVIEAAAHLAAAIGQSCSAVRLLCTSREPLRIEGEHLIRVPPLDVPAAQANCLEEVLATGSAQLFVQCAQRAHPDFLVPRQKARVVGWICRQLDGVPLAIELGAARAGVLGVDELARALAHPLRLLDGTSRSVPPRQQSLRAALDWSYEPLPESLRLALCRLSVFAGDFCMEAAVGVLGADRSAATEVAEQVAVLADKSLLSIVNDDAGVRYRMLETTRAYAREKLQERGWLECCARRHAEVTLALLKRQYEPQVPGHPHIAAEVGAALDWALCNPDESALAAELAAAGGYRLQLPQAHFDAQRIAHHGVADRNADIVEPR